MIANVAEYHITQPYGVDMEVTCVGVRFSYRKTFGRC